MTRTRTTIAAALASLALGAGVGTAAENGGTAMERYGSAVCFDRASWNADPGDRPCARIVRLYEDASVCVRVGPADRSTSRRVCVGNPFD